MAGALEAIQRGGYDRRVAQATPEGKSPLCESSVDIDQCCRCITLTGT